MGRYGVILTALLSGLHVEHNHYVLHLTGKVISQSRTLKRVLRRSRTMSSLQSFGALGDTFRRNIAYMIG